MSILDSLKSKVLVLDGAMGTMLQRQNPTAKDFGGDKYLGCNDYLNKTCPEMVKAVHNQYLEAGADIIETNSFGTTPLVLEEYNLGQEAEELSKLAGQIARACADKFSTLEKPRYVAGSMGPTTKALALTGGITFEELTENFRVQARGLISGGVDYLLLETAMDTLNLKAGILGIREANNDLGTSIPLAISVTIETMGTMLAGQDIEALYTSLEYAEPLYIGLNCAAGAKEMGPHLERLAAVSRLPVSFVPNAGMPDEDGNYSETPENFAANVKPFIQRNLVNIVGGCCGTTPLHIAALTKIAVNASPRTKIPAPTSRVSGMTTLFFNNDRPYKIGERTNVIGSRAFKNLIAAENFEQAAEIAKKQTQTGAHVIDICLSNPDRDEVTDMANFLDHCLKRIRAPFMIDSQNPESLETALKRIQGKCILNSVNLENDCKNIRELIPVLKKYGGMVVVGCIKDKPAITVAEKIAVAKEAHKLLTEEYKIPEQDLIFDTLVFPCATGEESYKGSALATIEAVVEIKKLFPLAKIILGVSNVSFGLPVNGREVLNSVFLDLAVKKGVDMAIINTEKLLNVADIPTQEYELCQRLLFNDAQAGEDLISEFANYYRNKEKPVVKTVVIADLTWDDDLKKHVIEGSKVGIQDLIDQGLKEKNALEIINGPLMAAMDEVGIRFGNNELIVAEVLQSAEVMKAATSYLEKFMDSGQSRSRGKILLGTVKGDVHDIGKNLVSMIWANNSFEVIDIGTNCSAESLVEAIKEHKPQAIGLSSLLVKSAQEMISTAKTLADNGVSIPLFVGGAALSEKFAENKIQPVYPGKVIYCKDAIAGLKGAQKYINQTPTEYSDSISVEVIKDNANFNQKFNIPSSPTPEKVKALLKLEKRPTPPSFKPVILKPEVAKVWDYLNMKALLGRHFDLKNKNKALLSPDGSTTKEIKIKEIIEQVKTKIIKEELIKPIGMYQFFKVMAKENTIKIFDKKENILQTTIFPRTKSEPELSLADYFDSSNMDSLAFFVVSCGHQVREYSLKLKESGEFLMAHALQAIAIELVEGFAEYMHQEIRKVWGIDKGIRVSFGYPLCPDMNDQKIIWNLLKPQERINVDLTENNMMTPEASISAMVIHHPKAAYFRMDS